MALSWYGPSPFVREGWPSGRMVCPTRTKCVAQIPLELMDGPEIHYADPPGCYDPYLACWDVPEDEVEQEWQLEATHYRLFGMLRAAAAEDRRSGELCRGKD